MDVAFNEGPVAVQTHLGATDPIKLNRHLGFKACCLKAQIQPAYAGEEADNLEH